MLRRRQLAGKAAPKSADVRKNKRGWGTGGSGRSSKAGKQPQLQERASELEDVVFGAAVTDRTPVIGADHEIGEEGHPAIGVGTHGLVDGDTIIASTGSADDNDDDDDADVDADSDDGQGPSQTRKGAGPVIPARVPAWNDEDDQDEQIDVTARPRTKKLRKTEDEVILDGKIYESRLRAQFEKIHGGKPKWADTKNVDSSTTDGAINQLPDSDNEAERDTAFDDGEDDSFLRQSTKQLITTATRLPKGVLDVTMVRDANHAAPSHAVVQALQFHPRIPAVMTAGLDKTLRIFQVDGKANRLLQSVHIPDLPIYSAHFASAGTEIVLSGRRKFFYVYDLQTGTIRKIDEIQGRSEKSLEYMYADPDSDRIAFTGRNGEIILVSSRTKQCCGTLKMNGAVNALAFLENKNKLLSSGRDGKVYLWDLRAQRCEHVFVDEGCISSTSLAVSAKDRYFACGSDTGVVNIYDESCLTHSEPKPLKAVMNLTTAVNHLEFHPDSQILGMSSRSAKDGLRMVHIPSMTVFKNWPTGRTPLNYVNTFAFSPRGGYLSMGNDKGKALLYRLNHYSQL